MEIGLLAELRAGKSIWTPIAVTEEDPSAVENGDSELALEIAQRSEHTVDRAA